MTPRPTGSQTWAHTEPEWFPTWRDHNEGSQVHYADADELRRIGLGEGHAVLVGWK